MSKACRTIALTGLMMIIQTVNSAIVEVRLDDSILPNVTLVDGNEQYTTDASGTLVLEDSCLSLRYVDDNNNAFGRWSGVVSTLLTDSTRSV